MEFLREVHVDSRNYMTSDRWFQNRNSPLKSVAYFSPEFGLTETLPQYSGGLGVLAGDHLRPPAASVYRSSGSGCSTGRGTSARS